MNSFLNAEKAKAWANYSVLALTIAGAVIIHIAPALNVATSILIAGAAIFAFYLNHRSGLEIKVLEQEVHRQEGQLRKNHPKLHTSAAIIGQGQLASWNYDQLVEELKKDGYIS